MTLRCPDCHCAGPFATADDTNLKCPICARTFAGKSLEKVAYVDRKRTAADLVHRTARKELASRAATATAPPSLDLVVDSLASIIVAGTSFDPETTDKREAISAVLEQASAAQAQTAEAEVDQTEAVEPPPEPPPAPEPSAQPINRIQHLQPEPEPPVAEISHQEVAEEQDTAQPAAAPVEPGLTHRLQQLRAEQHQAATDAQRERDRAEEFLLSRTRIETQQTEIAELISQIEIDRAEADKLQQQRLQAEQHAAQQHESAQAELKRLQAEHFEVADQITQQQQRLGEQQAAANLRQQQLTEATDRLHHEIARATQELKSLQAPPDPDQLTDESVVALQRQELKRLQAERVNVTDQVEQQQQRLQKQKAAAKAEGQQLTESIDKLRKEIDTATAELKSLQSAPEADKLHDGSDIVQRQQELERLQIERLNVADQIAQQQQRSRDQQAAAELKRQQLTENIDTLRQEITAATEELEKVKAASDSQQFPNDSDIEQRHQELIDQRAAVQAALAKQQQLASERAELQAVNAPKKEQLDVLRRETAAGIAELKKLRKANTAPLPQPAELNTEIEKLRTTGGKLARGLQAARKAVSKREAELKAATAGSEAQQKEAQQLKAKIKKDHADYKAVMARKSAIEAEIKTQVDLPELAKLQEERAEAQARLADAKRLLEEATLARNTGQAGNELQQREVRLLEREIRADVRETQDILSAVVRDRSEPSMRPIPIPNPMSRPPGAPLPPLDFSKPLTKGVSPVQRATLEPFEDDGASEDDEEVYLGPPTPDSSEEVREPGSTRITLMSVGMTMVAVAMAATSVMAGMWLYSGYENGTAISDAFNQCLPIAKIAIPSLWGIGALLSLLIPRVAGAHSEGIASAVSLAGMLGAVHLYDGRMTPEIWLIVCGCGILYAFLFQSFMAELCAFGGFRTCEKMSERLMGVTTLLLLAALSLGIAWWVRTDTQTQLAITRATVLALAILCVATATVIGRILMNVGTEQAHGREWLLEHV